MSHHTWSPGLLDEPSTRGGLIVGGARLRFNWQNLQGAPQYATHHWSCPSADIKTCQFLRQKFAPLFEKVLSGKKAALFFQIDRRLYALMDLQTASEVPLVLQ